jgi:hypothetical protein
MNGNNKTRGAEAALHAAFGKKCLLHITQLAVLANAFDSDNLGIHCSGGQLKA